MGKLYWQMIGYQLQISPGVILAAIDYSYGTETLLIIKNMIGFCASSKRV
jgi:hypothetical protein